MSMPTQLPVSPVSEKEERSSSRLKLITAVIRPEKMSEVFESLNQCNLVGGITMTDIRGNNRAPVVRQHCGVPFIVRVVGCVKVEVVVSVDDAHDVVECIRAAASTGHVGDGKIWVTDVSAMVRIRTGEKGLAAL